MFYTWMGYVEDRIEARRVAVEAGRLWRKYNTLKVHKEWLYIVCVFTPKPITPLLQQWRQRHALNRIFLDNMALIRQRRLYLLIHSVWRSWTDAYGLYTSYTIEM